MSTEDEKAAEAYAHRQAREFGWPLSPIREAITEAFLAGIAHQKAKERWIPVSERLPEETAMYRVAMLSASKDRTPYEDHVCWLDSAHGWQYGDEYITHWKPIELPSDKEGE